MHANGNHSGITRRDFSKAATAGVIGLTVTAGLARAAEEKAAEAAAASAPKIPLRDLGKTGLKVSEISLGAMDVEDPAVVEKALDDGCTYIDTAAAYQSGENEKMVGTVMARRRKEVVLATKFSPGSKEEIQKSVDRSLKSLQTDVIDVIQVHSAKSANTVKNPVFKEAFDELKKQGKVKFLGFTTHSNQIEVINASIEVGYVDSMLIGFNFSQPPELGEAIKRAREAGIGIVIMKAMKDAKKAETMPGKPSTMTPYQAAARWVLDKPYIDTLNIGMTSFEEIDENLKAVNMKLSALDRLQLRRFASSYAARTCSLCGACGGCARAVEASEIMRVHMYAFSYGNLPKARAEFMAMGGPAMLAACANCGACEKKCPRNLNIRQSFREVASLIA